MEKVSSKNTLAEHRVLFLLPALMPLMSSWQFVRYSSTNIFRGYYLHLLDSETAKAMMPDYHIGNLDGPSRKVLSESEMQLNQSDIPRPVFLDSKIWTKATLHHKTFVSWDSRIFTFKLEHDDQILGLPIGHHLMMRLRHPVTREAIIRSYTPINEQIAKGYLDILVKVYFDNKERKGGKMTKALDELPIGHSIDFKGPIGKFEYLGRGRCSINGIEREIKKFFMISAGSGVTPIYQVFRAVMQDPEDKTYCVMLNGNRCFEDILCKEDLDRFATGNGHRCRLLYTLTKASEEWTGLRGRIGQALLMEYVSPQDEAMVLICGPEALERSVHTILNELGWKDGDLLFF